MNKTVVKKFKDVIFVDLFNDPKYILMLYKELHPEDKEVSVCDVENVNLKKILVNDVYNDLGFLVKDKFIIMVEAQSTWSPNIVLRALIYLFETYKEYIQKNKLDIYGSSVIKIPKPELYVIYTGNRKERPDHISFKEVYFPEEENLFIDGIVKMLYDNNKDGIICQYNRLIHTIEKSFSIYEDPLEALSQAIDICIEQNILVDYLKKRKQEVLNKMADFWDEESAREIHEYNLMKEAEEKGIEKGINKLVDVLRELKHSEEEIKEQLKTKFDLTDQEVDGFLCQ